MNKYGIILIAGGVFIILLFSFLHYVPPKRDVITIIESEYMTKEGIIRDYGRKGDVKLLSESLGLYMEYLLLRADQKRFHQQFDVLMDHFLVRKGSDTFLKWELAKGVSTNALVDDLRIIDVLLRASETFHKPIYRETALKLFQTIQEKQKTSAGYVDFYDWHHEQRADTLHLSYLYVHLLTTLDPAMNSSDVYARFRERHASLFYHEYYSYDTHTFKEEHKGEVNLIDQFLIELQLTSIGERNETFYQWVKSEMINEHKLYGRYTKDRRPKPAVSYESSAVYALGTQYFLDNHDEQMAKEFHQRLSKFQLQSQADYDSIHFFDFINYALAHWKYQHQE